jgi:hypothetical protein
MPRIKKTNVPELVGAAEAAELLGVAVSNLDRVANLPAPATTLRATRVWVKADIEALAEKRRAS